MENTYRTIIYHEKVYPHKYTLRKEEEPGENTFHKPERFCC
jgi:hypothetical protein